MRATISFDLSFSRSLLFQAYELSTLTGTQVMLLVASETGHVYTFATPKLQPMITSETGKALIQTCLHTPDPAAPAGEYDIRMSVGGYEETDLGYSMNEEESFKVCHQKFLCGVKNLANCRVKNLAANLWC